MLGKLHCKHNVLITLFTYLWWLEGVVGLVLEIISILMSMSLARPHFGLSLPLPLNITKVREALTSLVWKRSIFIVINK